MKVETLPESLYLDLVTKFRKEEIIIGVVGVGYVGKALVEGMVSTGYRVLGYDKDVNKSLQINHKLYSPINSAAELEVCDVICVSVPTPVDKEGKPDLTSLIGACQSISSLNKLNKLIVIESTVAPGTLRNTVLPIFTRGGRELGKDFLLAISPERVDPGNKKFNIKNTPKVVGGIGKESTLLTTLFYSKFVDKVVPCSSPEVAELSKVFENTFRLVNISLVNEVQEYAENIGLNMWEVIEVAATKPFGFMPHYPGPGVGGHCIPVDPIYLLEDAKNRNINLRILESAIQVNSLQPNKVLKKAKRALDGYTGGKVPKLFIIGVTYKPNVPDTRESPGIKILEEAEKQGFEVSYFDPYVPELNGYTSSTLNIDTLNSQDVIIIATDHKDITYDLLAKVDKPIIDTRNALNKYYVNNRSKVEGEYS